MGRATTGGCPYTCLRFFLRPLRSLRLNHSSSYDRGRDKSRPYVPLVLLYLRVCAARANFSGVEDFSDSDIPPAKTQSSEEKNNNPQTNSLPPIRPLRLGVFAGDIPRLTGARSAPYENFFASFAFFAAILLFFRCGFAALGALWLFLHLVSIVSQRAECYSSPNFNHRSINICQTYLGSTE